jgi:hypothetical protein
MTMPSAPAQLFRPEAVSEYREPRPDESTLWRCPRFMGRLFPVFLALLAAGVATLGMIRQEVRATGIATLAARARAAPEAPGAGAADPAGPLVATALFALPAAERRWLRWIETTALEIETTSIPAGHFRLVRVTPEELASPEQQALLRSARLRTTNWQGMAQIAVAELDQPRRAQLAAAQAVSDRPLSAHLVQRAPLLAIFLR